jgi:hydrogenase 3 maturation protease
MGSSKDEPSNTDEALETWVSKAQRVVIAGIGNPLRRDDFVGMKIVRDLQDRISERVCLIECETVPESFIEPITEFHPTHILIIDAATLNLKPGSSRLVSQTQIASRPAISSHALPLQAFCRYLAETTGAEISVLAIQPEDASFGEGLTKAVEGTAKHLVELLLRTLP